MSNPLAGLERHLQIYHGATLDDVEVTDTPGYWQLKKPCGGRGECPSPLHSTLGNDGPTQHTICYHDPTQDERGRFRSPYRTWRAAREASHGG